MIQPFEVGFVDRQGVRVAGGDCRGRLVVRRVIDRLRPGVVGQNGQPGAHALLRRELQRVVARVAAHVGLGDGLGIAARTTHFVVGPAIVVRVCDRHGIRVLDRIQFHGRPLVAAMPGHVCDPRQQAARHLLLQRQVPGVADWGLECAVRVVSKKSLRRDGRGIRRRLRRGERIRVARAGVWVDEVHHNAV